MKCYLCGRRDKPKRWLVPQHYLAKPYPVCKPLCKRLIPGYADTFATKRKAELHLIERKLFNT